MGINKVILIGNVGKDPEVRHLEGGVSVATITLATSERYRDRTTGESKEITEWHTINAWRQLADIAEKFIRKGSKIYVEGRLRSRSWDGQDGQKHYVTEVLADSIELLDRRQDAQSPYGGQQRQWPAREQQSPYQQMSQNQQMSVPQMPSSTSPVASQHPVSVPAVSPEDLEGDGSDDLPF